MSPARVVSRRLQGMVQSDIRRMTRECERVGGINLGQGICDLPTFPLVRDGAIEAIRAQKSTYSVFEGIAELRQVIAEKLARDNRIAADPKTEIVVTVGASGAYAAACLALLDPGDGIVLFEPYYGYHLNTAILCGLEPRYVTLRPPGWTVTREGLETAVDERTRAIVVCTPSNPSGKMFSRAEIELVADVARRRDLLVLTDEIYEYIRYDGREHVCPATVPGLRERTVTMMGLSKTFSITGWRLGYAVAPPEMARAIGLVNDLLCVCAPTPLQHGGAAGFRAPREFFDGLARDYQRKRDAICDALRAGGFEPFVPEGAYYVLADFCRLGFASAEDAAMTLLERAKVAAVQGTAFYRGDPGDRLLRFCYAVDDDVLAEACRRIRTFRA